MPLPIERRDDRKKLGDADQVQVRVGELEEELAHLKASYEQYFLGVERRPPTDAHDRFKKALKDLKLNFVRHTGANFRVQGLSAKYLTYERLWTRTLQEMEAGTYKRDVYKAKRKQRELDEQAKWRKKRAANGEEAANPESTPPEADPLGAHAESSSNLKPVAPRPAEPLPPPPPDDFDEIDAALDGLGEDAPRPQSKPKLAPVPVVSPSKAGLPAVAAKPGRPVITAARAESPSMPMVKGVAPTANAGELSEKKIKAIYDAYVMAKKRCNEDVSKLSVDSLATTLRKQVPELMKQHGAKSVEFKVVIKDGKAILRALPKD